MLFTCFALTTGRLPRSQQFSRSRAEVQAELSQKIAATKAHEQRGEFKEAELGYKDLLRNPLTRRSPVIRLDYAKLLEHEGRHNEALEEAEPLVNQGAQVDAVVFSLGIIDRREGRGEGDRFLDEIRRVPLNGLSINDYAKKGLSARETILFVQGTNEEGKEHWGRALAIYREVMPDYPPSIEFYLHVGHVLAALHRSRELAPIIEEWYLHSSASEKLFIKRRYNYDFDRLDRLGRP